MPYDVVSSEFLTMEGRKFSSSRGVAIYVRDFLERYDPDALRYYLTAAGPESQDTDFTWDELVATWGNLVNRVLSIAYKHFGAVPDPGPLHDGDRELLAHIEEGFAKVGDEIALARFKSALNGAMRLADRANRYLNDQEPWRLVKEDRARAGTVLYTALRAIDSLKVILSPFLPFSAQALHEMLGYRGSLAGTLRFEEVAEGNGRTHRILTGDYREHDGRWEPSALAAGQPLVNPAPLFKKLDASIVDEELARLERQPA